MNNKPNLELLQAEIAENDERFFRTLVLVAMDPENGGNPHFALVDRTSFPAVESTWHGTSVEYLECSIGRKLRTGIYEVQCPLFDDTVVAKFALPLGSAVYRG